MVVTGTVVDVRATVVTVVGLDVVVVLVVVVAGAVSCGCPRLQLPATTISELITMMQVKRWTTGTAVSLPERCCAGISGMYVCAVQAAGVARGRASGQPTLGSGHPTQSGRSPPAPMAGRMDPLCRATRSPPSAPLGQRVERFLQNATRLAESLGVTMSELIRTPPDQGGPIGQLHITPQNRRSPKDGRTASWAGKGAWGSRTSPFSRKCWSQGTSRVVRVRQVPSSDPKRSP